jgi:hypothetical protein
VLSLLPTRFDLIDQPEEILRHHLHHSEVLQAMYADRERPAIAEPASDNVILVNVLVAGDLE